MEEGEHLDIDELHQVGATDLVVIIEKGAEFQPSERLNKALSELSAALAEEEVGEVSGFAFEPTMSFGTLEGPDANGFKIGCVRTGCVKGVFCSGTRTGCDRTVNKGFQADFSF